MVSRSYSLILLLSLIPLHVSAKYVELITKQAAENVRFISIDNKNVYYQRNSGSLLLAAKYRVHEIVKGESNTQYGLTSGDTGKVIIISQNKSHHNDISFRQNSDIYLTQLGATTSTMVGKGVSPTLHLNDRWFSFYDINKKTITFNTNEREDISLNIKLLNKINPFFIPERIMLSENKVLYTDINNEGFQGLLTYDRKTKKTETIYKTSTPGRNLQLCLQDGKLIMAEIPLSEAASNSYIYVFEKIPQSIKEKKLIFDSKGKTRMGQIACNLAKGKIFFTQSFPDKEEVATLDLGSGKMATITDLKYVNNIFNMHGRLVIAVNGRFYVDNSTQESIGDNLPQSSNKEKK